MKYCVTFAGPVGASKTPIAYYLSVNFGLPVFNNDAIRTEVVEDIRQLDQQEYERRRDERLEVLLTGGKAFIYDASVDRQWERLKEKFGNKGYRWFLVSMDMTKDFLHDLYELKGYEQAVRTMDRFLEDHKLFLQQYEEDVNLHIDERNFANRLEEARMGLEFWLNKAEVSDGKIGR